MPKLSIIVCTYNGENTLEKCINSILNQTFSDFELIIVDDGSTDNSNKIYEKYKAFDNRVRVIFKENSGLGDARNIGLDNSTGEYIGFVDSDDYIEPDMYEILYNNAIKHNADISCCRIFVEFMDKTIISPNPNGEYCKKFKISSETIELFWKGNYYVKAMWNKIYHKKIFEELRIPKGAKFEDDLVFFQTLEKSKIVVCDSKSKYHYVQSHTSLIRGCFKKTDLELIECGNYTLSIVRDRYPNLIKFTEARVLGFRKRIIDKILDLDKYENIEIAQEQQKEIRFVLKEMILNNEMRLGMKCALISIAINLNFYKILLKMKRLLL